MNVRSMWVSLAVSSAVGLVLGCGNNSQQQPPPAFQGQAAAGPYATGYPPQGGYAAAPQGGYAAAPQGGYAAAPPAGYAGAPAYPPTGAPTATTAPTGAPAAGPGLDPSQAVIAQQILAPLASQNAPGAKAVTSPIGGFLQQGQTAEVAFTAEPGKCYTGVGAGTPPVQGVQLEVTLAPPAPPMTLLQTQDVTITPVLGPKGQCFRTPIPIPSPAIFRVRATQGGGMIYAQLFGK